MLNAGAMPSVLLNRSIKMKALILSGLTIIGIELGEMEEVVAIFVGIITILPTLMRA